MNARPSDNHGKGRINPPPPALAPLVAERRWLVWRWETNAQGKRTKVPYRADATNNKASSTDADTWCDYATACAAVRAGQVDGIGFALYGSKFAAFDIDDCRDPETGTVAPWAWRLIDEACSYTEVTVSGTGVRIIGTAEGGYVHRKQPYPGADGSVETYRSASRYIVVTFDELKGTSWSGLANIDQVIDATVACLDTAKAEAKAKDKAAKQKQKSNQSEQAKPNGSANGHGARDAFREAGLPADLLGLIINGAPVGRRSEEFHHAVGWLKQLGWPEEDIKVLLRRYPTGIAEKYFARGDLDRQVESSFSRTDDPQPKEPPPGPPPVINASRFVYLAPGMIPRREWIYGHEFIRRHVTATIAPGGLGKSSHAIVEAVAMVSGQNLIGDQPTSTLRCWIWNGEDPIDELQRRITAAIPHYELNPAEIEGRLFVNSGRDTEIIIARQDRNGVTIAEPVVAALIATIQANSIDHVTIDPFVSSHQVIENDNPAVDRVAKTFVRIAEATGCAFNLVHHTRKTGSAEITVEDGRGAVALISAARVARVLNVMTEAEAGRAGVENRRLHFRLDNGKSNLAPPAEKSRWFKIESVELGNCNFSVGALNMCGDSVGVVTSWEWPDPFEDVTVADLRAAQKAVSVGRWRENSQAAAWVGKPIAEALRLNLSNPHHKAKVKTLLKRWTANGMFVVVDGKDERHETRSFVEVGQWAND